MNYVVLWYTRLKCFIIWTFISNKILFDGVYLKMFWHHARMPPQWKDRFFSMRPWLEKHQYHTQVIYKQKANYIGLILASASMYEMNPYLYRRERSNLDDLNILHNIPTSYWKLLFMPTWDIWVEHAHKTKIICWPYSPVQTQTYHWMNACTQ